MIFWHFIDKMVYLTWVWRFFSLFLNDYRVLISFIFLGLIRIHNILLIYNLVLLCFSLFGSDKIIIIFFYIVILILIISWNIFVFFLINLFHTNVYRFFCFIRGLMIMHWLCVRWLLMHLLIHLCLLIINYVLTSFFNNNHTLMI